MILKHLRDAACRSGTEAIEQFKAAVQRSGKLLSPLDEPLKAFDFTEHRWMAGHREESYSDWLQWILVQFEPSEVLAVLGVNDPEIIASCSGKAVTITRYRCVRHGHDDSSGRLDLDIRIGDEIVLIVEVKLDDADRADTAKGTGYCRSVEVEEPEVRFKKYVILGFLGGYTTFSSLNGRPISPRGKETA
jgi:hypothetical protein